ncbi:MAG: HlyD family secretion protein [Ignavibacteria bacterium]|jgi:membrane fusion protein (multidrug efflux system)|nr:HlyD family secretion protein [Ignavibacteria bacterium]MCU7501744.1 HlyD family secretion protein [Ignavibacteria bacterium]MCU7516849.1 HlyD family secretion protein [Ignavibacteria bacterium]
MQQIKLKRHRQNQQDDGEAKIESTPVYKKKRVLIPLFIFLVLVALGIYWYMGQQGYISTDDAYIDGNKATLSSKMLGRIDSLAADEGDTVKVDEKLVMLDRSDLQAQGKSAAASINNAQESITLAKVNLEKAKDDFQRAKSQFQNNIIPKEQYDHAARALEAAQAEYNISVSRVGTAKAQLGVIQTNLLNGIILSPMNGVIAKRWVLAGDVVQPGQPIYTIYDTKNIWITAQLEETKVSSIKPGDYAEIDIDAYPDQKFYGKVFQIGSNTASQFSLIPPNNASGNFTKVTQRVPVKISIEGRTADSRKTQGKFALLPGMSAEVRIKEGGVK